MGNERPTYIELGDGTFLNADQVSWIEIDAYKRVSIRVHRISVEFHADLIHGDEQAARAATLALLSALGRAPEDTDKLRVITYLDGSVQTRYL